MIERFFNTIRIGLIVAACAPLGAVTLRQERQDPPKPRQIEIAITTDGFEPGRVEVQAGIPVELVFTRKTDKTCATEVTVPALKVKTPLPLNEPVTVSLTPEKGEITFACGMNMLKGKLVVKADR